jgi:hypothetical protein
LGFLLNTIGRLFRSYCAGEEKKKKRGNNSFHDPHSPYKKSAYVSWYGLAFTVNTVDFTPQVRR